MDSRLFDGLEVPDEVLERVQALLHREGELVVDGPQELGHTPRCYKVRRPAQADAERVQLVLKVVRVLRLLQVPTSGTAKTFLRMGWGAGVGRAEVQLRVWAATRG